MISESVTILVKKCQSGDISAFDSLVKLYSKQIYQLAYHIAGNYEDAKDISQEAFINTYRSINKFKGESSFSTWLRRITINISINHIKKESRIKQRICDQEISENIVDPADNPLRSMEVRELAYKVKEELSLLPIEERIVFILRVNQGLSYKEIAKTLGCPEGTVMSQLNRARRRLRDKLKDYII